VDRDGLDVSPRLRDDLDAYVDLQRRADAFTVALFLDRNAPELEQQRS
jgi:hypothetical protein